MRSGFTLAELLIALAILGAIATFTIPKVLQSQQDTKFKSVAREAVGMLSESYTKHVQAGKLSVNTTSPDLTAYMNYIQRITVGTVDHWYGQAGITLDCSVEVCLLLSNGSVAVFDGGRRFNGTASTNAVVMKLDPDGKVSSSPASSTGPGKSVAIFLYYNGRIASYGTCFPGTTDSAGVFPCPNAGAEPPWFNWD